MTKSGNGHRETLSQADIDRLRHEFADRLNTLIGDEKDEKNLENFSRKTGISMRQLSQWKNNRHLNWPSAGNLIRIAKFAHVSIDWLLMGPSNVKRKASGS